MKNLIRTLSVIVALICVLTTTDVFNATVSPQQLLPQDNGASARNSPNTDSAITTLPPATAPEAIPHAEPDGTVVIVPPATAAPPSTTIIVPPVAQEQPQAMPVPTIPEIPSTTVVIPQKTEPPAAKTDIPEKAEEEKNLTPADFLPKTPAKPDKSKKAEKTKPKQSEPEAPLTARKGDALKIPPDAGKTKDLSFLEGCWRGTRPEYGTKRIVTERFCFGKNGTGKRFIEDPKVAGTCVGATRAVINSGGVLRMMSDRMYCAPSGKRWEGSEMTCQGEGSQTPCTWVFSPKDKQSYRITFVRE
jgi:hypothetical protein